ncbi:MAG: peptide ABC transporter ATP-binding protein, partial [Lactococcus sp.]|nr:peptide ABC transporter ATP-binding protein [Lactococcus sp.]
MNKRTKIIGAGLLSVAALGFLGACGNKSESSKSDNKDYSFYYVNDPETLDYTFSGQRYTAENTANFVDGL